MTGKPDLLIAQIRAAEEAQVNAILALIEERSHG